VAPQVQSRHASVATIVEVDYERGLLNLETDIGQVLTFVAPEEVQDLREGDQIVVCLSAEVPAEDRPQNAISV
jgi:hypothetical protein